MTRPGTMDGGVDVHANTTGRRFLVTQDSARAQVRLDVGLMRRHQVDQALIALAFPAWISHSPIIVKSDDDVNEASLSPGHAATQERNRTTEGEE
ncbi:hypothetical protein WR25_15555 [Diploscapter pachys]|uniref:Uncharacterized protein n=1 Tax=Diploscapter pachys TaxID=2018661 RepID=A0A2A2JW22_9BILA|nr:hypothetical protein WR25_15555 [Diploscapter pachys]